jgi:hypothetical protein
LDTRFDLGTEIRKRRSVGFRTERSTWVRIEVRDTQRLNGQGWNGVECAAVLRGVAMPAWYQGIAWLDQAAGIAWRADETEFIADGAIKPGGTLTVEPALSEDWWTTFNASLGALATHTTTRVATPNLELISQDRVTAVIHEVFADVDTTIEEWSPAHADLGWANLTAPTCYLLDWEDWGMAPRGWDAATLWSQSFAVPDLAERIAKERAADFSSRTGKLVQLFHCAELITAPAGYAGPRLESAKAAAAVLLREL